MTEQILDEGSHSLEANKVQTRWIWLRNGIIFSFSMLFIYWVASALWALFMFREIGSAGSSGFDPDSGPGLFRNFSFLPYYILIPYFLAFLGQIFYIVMHCVLVFKMWQILPQEYRKTSPGLAVGLLFIPLFNFFWIFRAHYSLAKGIGQYSDDHNLGINPSKDIALSWCILICCSIIPILNILTLLAALILYFVMMIRLKNASRQLANSLDKLAM